MAFTNCPRFLSNRTGVIKRGCICQGYMSPRFGSLPKLKEMVVPLSKTEAGNGKMREQASLHPRSHHV